MDRRQFLSRLVSKSSRSYEDEMKQTLVVIFLRGGADTLNMVVPYGDDDYYRLRKHLAVKPPVIQGKGSGTAIKIDDFYGLHPVMSPLLPMYKEGRLAIIQAVGCHATQGSHFYVQDLIEHGVTDGQSLNTGWLARHLLSRPGGALSPMSAMAMGRLRPASLQGLPSVGVLEKPEDLELHDSSAQNKNLMDALGAMYAGNSGMLSAYGRNSLDMLERVKSIKAHDYSPETGVSYPQTKFGLHLMQMARLIKSGVGLEVGCIDYGGWDTHYLQGVLEHSFAALLSEFSTAFAAFDRDLQPVRDRVTVLVMTEFGRRFYPNAASGTDHGRGSAYMVLGENINGGEVLGRWPGLVEQHVEGPDGLQIEHDYRSILSEIIRDKMGNPNTDFVFPKFQSQKVGIVEAST